MTNRIDLAFRLISKYGATQCSRARLLHSIYLADWWALLHEHRRVTNIEWMYDNMKGPFNESFLEEIEKSKLFTVSRIPYENSTVEVKVVAIFNHHYACNVDDVDNNVIDIIYRETSAMNWVVFNAFVRSTYPLRVAVRGELIPLCQLAKEYRERVKH